MRGKKPSAQAPANLAIKSGHVWGNVAFAARGFVRLALLLTLFVVPVFVMPFQIGGVELGATRSPAVFSKELILHVLLSVVLCGAMVASSVVSWPRQTLVQMALLGYAATFVVSAVFSGRADYAFSSAGLWLLLLAAAWFVSQLQWSAGDLRGFLISSIAAGVVVSAYGLLVYFKIDPLRDFYPFQYGDETGRNFVSSFIGNPEYLGGYMACLAAICVALGLAPDARLAGRALWFGLAVVFLVVLLLSGTRGALLGFAGGGAVALLLQVGRLSRRARGVVLGLSALAVVAVAALLVVFSTPNMFNKRGVNVAARFASVADLQSASVRERILFYTLAGRMITENPIWGSGPGGFRLDFYPTVAQLVDEDKDGSMELTSSLLRGRVAENAHNDYLQIWVENGLVGVVTFLAMVAALVVQVFRPLRQEQDFGVWRRSRTIEIAAFCGVLTLLLIATFSFPMRTPERALLLWMLIAMTQSVGHARALLPVTATTESPADDLTAADAPRTEGLATNR